MIKKVRKASQAKVRMKQQGEKPVKSNTNHVKQLSRNETDPMADKITGDNLDNENIDVIILK